jgi:hypothetical protein
MGTLEGDVVTTPPEQRVLLDVDRHEHVACRSAVRTGTTTPTDTDDRAVLHPGRDLHGQLPRLDDPTGSAAGRTRGLDPLPTAAARGARLREREGALVNRDLAPAAADLAAHGRGPGSRSGPVAGVAGAVAGHPKRRPDARERVLEGQVDLGTQIAAATGPTRT